MSNGHQKKPRLISAGAAFAHFVEEGAGLKDVFRFLLSEQLKVYVVIRALDDFRMPIPVEFFNRWLEAEKLG